ncbi:GNAT family N-acetyltransferase [Cryptosporangium phraense]|uniref:GNAT family N-acetyltransferase n=1 Tax=Cryptosporangium phraense TaxID=2593070 RepID=A0A545APA6_9ACTN|nr:GNAT family N-acetyltransferase [Cryptosporangium phraense]TQS42575.1 GNAT family N-acetyltransferase [Cryptosporangium phraense]
MSLLGDPVSAVSSHPLDNPAWASLTGAHREFALISGLAARYQPDVSPFGVLGDTTPQAWADLLTLAGPDAVFPLAALEATPPEGFTVEWSLPGVQMIDESVDAEPDPEAVRLTAADVPEMLDLVARTRPGPFEQRTIELGTYLGIRRDGALVAMAGERMHPPGHTEISAVCTAPGHQGQGLAGRLVRAIAHEIRSRGEVPFLHAAATNTGAIALYEKLGFTLRKMTLFSSVRTPPS